MSVLSLSTVAMIAFAGNSLLCRLALRQNTVDAASFTGVRIASGALVLGAICLLRRRAIQGNWLSAGALFLYAAAFSFAYLSLAAGTGALLLFVAVQTTMIAAGLCRGERLRLMQWSGIAVALAGLVLLLLPGISAPPIAGALLMLVAGTAWGVYSLRGKSARDPLAATAGNFVRALPLTILMFAVASRSMRITTAGVVIAVISGAVTSGLGYVIWYAVLPALPAATAATVQLTVPVIAAFGGILFLGETLGLRIVVASIVVLGGIALAIVKRAAPSRRQI